MTKKKMTYENAFAELQEILESLQSQDIGLDDLAKNLQRAKELIEFCRTRLRAVEEDLDELFDEEEEEN